jgi:hypothetical protein
MATKWIDIKTDEEALQRKIDYWYKGEHTTDGVFWADRMKASKSIPKQCLKICIENFPLPAAFRHATIAARSIIKTKLKNNQNILKELQLLYRIEAVDSFRLDYSPICEVSGYNIIERVPGYVLWSTKLNYSQLGFNEFRLANKTDKKWFLEHFGTPRSHSTLQKVRIDLWNKYEQIFQEERDDVEGMFERLGLLDDDIDDDFDERNILTWEQKEIEQENLKQEFDKPTYSTLSDSNNGGCCLFILLFIIAMAIIFYATITL